MPSLKDFVASLQAGWFPALAALVGCSIIVLGDHFSVPYLDQSPKYLLTIAVVVGVFAFSVLVANIAYLPVRVWKILYRRRTDRKFRAHMAREIQSAPAAELAILAYLVTSGRKAFAAEFNNPKLTPLVSKGLIIRMSGTHSILEWPYIVRQEVWDYLVDHSDQFHIDIPEGAGDPFNWRGGW